MKWRGKLHHVCVSLAWPSTAVSGCLLACVSAGPEAKRPARRTDAPFHPGAGRRRAVTGLRRKRLGRTSTVGAGRAAAGGMAWRSFARMTCVFWYIVIPVTLPFVSFSKVKWLKVHGEELRFGRGQRPKRGHPLPGEETVAVRHDRSSADRSGRSPRRPENA
jgi:hypothetical protein